MSAEDQRLDRQKQSLRAQDDGVHDTDRIDPVKKDPGQEPQIFFFQPIVVAGVGIGNTAAAGRDTVQAAFVKRL